MPPTEACGSQPAIPGRGDPALPEEGFLDGVELREPIELDRYLELTIRSHASQYRPCAELRCKTCWLRELDRATQPSRQLLVDLGSETSAAEVDGLARDHRFGDSVHLNRHIEGDSHGVPGPRPSIDLS